MKKRYILLAILAAGLLQAAVVLGGGNVSSPFNLQNTTDVGNSTTNDINTSGSMNSATATIGGGVGDTGCTGTPSGMFVCDGEMGSHGFVSTGDVSATGGIDAATGTFSSDVLISGSLGVTGNIYATGTVCMDGACVYGIDTNGSGDFNDTSIADDLFVIDTIWATGPLCMDGACLYGIDTSGSGDFNDVAVADDVVITDDLFVTGDIWATGVLCMDGACTYGINASGIGDFNDVLVADDVIAVGDGLFTGNIYATGALCMDGACVYGIQTDGDGDFADVYIADDLTVTGQIGAASGSFSDEISTNYFNITSPNDPIFYLRGSALGTQTYFDVADNAWHHDFIYISFDEPISGPSGNGDILKMSVHEATYDWNGYLIYLENADTAEVYYSVDHEGNVVSASGMSGATASFTTSMTSAGYASATAYWAGANEGLTSSIEVTDKTGLATCTIQFASGVYYATDCP